MCESEELDFSIKTYEEWISFLFDRPLKKEPDENPFEGESITTFPERPLVLIDYFTRLCRELPDLVTIYDWPQIDQALWGALSVPFMIAGEYLWDSQLPLAPRIECVHAMESMFPNVVARMPEGVARETNFYMWWDIVCSGYDSGDINEIINASPEEKNELLRELNKMLDLVMLDVHSPEDIVKFKNRYGEQFETEKIKTHSCRVSIEALARPNGPLLQAVFEALQNILALDDSCCQEYALHGLGHCPHPGSAAVVQGFIDRHREEIKEAGADFMKWLEACRDGTVM